MLESDDERCIRSGEDFYSRLGSPSCKVQAKCPSVPRKKFPPTPQRRGPISLYSIRRQDFGLLVSWSILHHARYRRLPMKNPNSKIAERISKLSILAIVLSPGRSPRLLPFSAQSPLYPDFWYTNVARIIQWFYPEPF